MSDIKIGNVGLDRLRKTALTVGFLGQNCRFLAGMRFSEPSGPVYSFDVNDFAVLGVAPQSTVLNQAHSGIVQGRLYERV